METRTNSTITQKEFNKQIHVYSSNKDKNGDLVVKYSLLIDPNTLGIKQTARIKDFGGAKKSLYNHQIIESN